MNTAYIGLALLVVMVVLMAFAVYVEVTDLKPRYYALMDKCPCWCAGSIDAPSMEFNCSGNHSRYAGSDLWFLNVTRC